jgi:hypothetical protein
MDFLGMNVGTLYDAIGCTSEIEDRRRVDETDFFQWNRAAAFFMVSQTPHRRGRVTRSQASAIKATGVVLRS